MGFSTYLRKFKNCCQGNSDNYFDESSYKNERGISTEDFLKKRVDSDESALSNGNFNSSSILKDDKISEVKRVEIDEASILSDKNINQLRQRNPRLNRFNNDVIRLSLRKSLYANNLEQDLENFLKEQQREANKFDRRENPYTISDMRELYELINTISVKDKQRSESQSVKEEPKKEDTIEQEDLIKSEITTSDHKSKPLHPKVEKIKSSLKLHLPKKNRISSVSSKDKLLVEKTEKKNSKSSKDKLVEKIHKKNSKSSKTKLKDEIKEDPQTNKSNSDSSYPKDTIIPEPRNCLCSSPEQHAIEIDESSTPLHMNDKNKHKNSNHLMKSPDMHSSGILFQSPNVETTEKKPHLLLSSSPLPSEGEIIDFPPLNQEKSSIPNLETHSSPSNPSNIDGSTPGKDKKLNIICSLPPTGPHEPLLLGDPSSDDPSKTNPSPHLLSSSPPQSYPDHEILCESPTDDILNTNHSPSVFCSSPQQSFHDPGQDGMCESPVDDNPNLQNSPNHLLCSSPEPSEMEMDPNAHSLLYSSPSSSFSEMTDNKASTKNNPNSSKKKEKPQSILCSSPQQDYHEMMCASPVEDEDDLKPGMLLTSPQQKFSDKLICQSPTEHQPHPLPKPSRKSTGFSNSFNSLESLANSHFSLKKDNSAMSSRDKDLIYSQLKMTELSKKSDNSLLLNSIKGSIKSLERKKMGSHYSHCSHNSEGSFQSVYSYDNIENMSSRKITKRALKVLNSRDTLKRQKPVNLKSRNRKALLIGINYTGKPYQLQGCINDARYLMNFLKENYDFKMENCKIMTDDAEDESLIPTKENIINAMKWLVADAKAGDSLFFHYSGHGLNIVDEDGDEIDGMDESILPVDYEEKGVILDDEIHDIMVKPLPKGCLFTALADCCHSGTVFDLPYSYNCNGEIESVKEMDQYDKEISKEYLSNEIYQKNKMIQELITRNTSPPPVKLTLEQRISIDNYVKRVKQSEADVIQYSSCRDNEISADEKANGNTYGALCNAFIATLTSLILEEKTISYIDLLKEIRTMIQKRYGQTPQLSTGRPMDVNQPFEL